jgi:mRNA interferase RelE/StbE
LKDLAKGGPFKKKSTNEKFVFEELPNSSSIESVGNFEKMKGYKGYYKIRFGDYRIGAHSNDSTIGLKRVLNGKEIYKFFPD